MNTKATKATKASKAFKTALVRAGLLGQHSGTILVWGIDGEDVTLRKWHAMARRFIYKDQRVRVAMHVERMHYNESRCWPEITLCNF